MSAISYLKGWCRVQRQTRIKRKILKEADFARLEILRDAWRDSLVYPTETYLKCFRFFHLQLPGDLQEHRAYFSKSRRGFGEDAFHVMWFLLFQEYRPSNFLEIGVYRGQTISLAALLQQKNGLKPNVTGISPFESAGDSVSRYRKDIDYLQDTLTNFQHFNLPEPELIRAYSTDEKALKVISSQRWDCIYIDGNHDYEIVQQDWKNCSAALSGGGIIVLDDSGLTTEYQPPIFSTKGHPGPSRMAQEIDRSRFREILQVGHNRVFQKIGS